MKSVLKYLSSLAPAERDAFARRCGTSVGYLRKASRSVVCEQIRTDVDWAYLRGTNPAASGAHTAQAAQKEFPHG